MATLQEKLYDVLQVSEENENAQAIVYTRLIGIECADFCTRCGGSGHYSYSLSHGTTCFKCEGKKYQMPKITKQLLTKVETAIEEGKLDKYFEEVKRRQQIKVFIKVIREYKIYFADIFEQDEFSKYYDAVKKKERSFERFAYELLKSHNKFLDEIEEKCSYFGRRVHRDYAEKKAAAEKDIIDNYKEYLEKIKETHGILMDREKLVKYTEQKIEESKANYEKALKEGLDAAVKEENWLFVKTLAELLIELKEG